MTQDKRASEQHAVLRTSPKGTPFVGTCSLCGVTGLTIATAQGYCENPRRLSSDEALTEILRPQ